MSDTDIHETRRRAQVDHIWADEGGLKLVLTHMTGNRLSVAIRNVVTDTQLASCTIANYRVKRVASMAASIAALHDLAVAEEQTDE